jgi:hypothetical protein
MKTSTKLFALGMILMGFGVNVNAQSTASAIATATIITPIHIDWVSDMNFGNLAVQTGTAGTIILTPAGTRTAYLGVTATAALGGTITAAAFNVTGQGSATYSISLPSTYTITRTGGTETMTVNTFTSSPATPGTLSAGGSQALTVGATLNVAAGQVAGVYTNGTGFDVTVNYN